MEEITLGELRSAVGGILLGDFADPNTVITKVVSDNRMAGPGSVFFAIVGEKTDGHKYVEAALAAGAAGCVISRAPQEYLPGKFYLLVEDTLQAAAQAAAFYRRKFDIPVVAVTGSVGKTTTKDMIAAVLSVKYHCVKTQKNFNNYIGVPRTVFTLDRDTEIAVIEMGMNHRGEIHHLVEIAQPTALTITNVGDAHIGLLGSRENIFRSKCEIFGGLAEGGYAVLNGDNDFLVRLRDEKTRDLIRNTTGMPKDLVLDFVGEDPACSFRAVDIRDDLPDRVEFTAVTPAGAFPVTVPALGRHMIYHALTAAALGLHYGMTIEEIRQGIAGYVATAMRMEVRTLANGSLLYDDSYNANPQSMEAGLLTLSRVQGKRRVAVLGQMGELGAQEEALHREVGAAAAKDGIDVLVTVGPLAALIAEEAKRFGLAEVHACKDKEEAKKVLDALYAPETAFLVKASRAAALEELSRYLEDKT